MNWLILILWICIGVMSFIRFRIDMKKDNNSDLKYYFWQYTLAWVMVMISLIHYYF